MPDKKPAAPKKKAMKPHADLVNQVQDDVLAHIEANQTVDTLPHGAQAGLFGGDNAKLKDGLKKLVKAVVPGLLEGAMVVGDGNLSPDKVKHLVEIAARVATELLQHAPPGQAA